MLKSFSIKRGWLLPVWISLGALNLAVEYWAGPNIALAYFFLVPVALAAHYNGRWWGLALAVALPAIRFAFHFAWDDPSSVWNSALNAAIRVLILGGAAYLVDRVNRQAREIRILRGILPICMYCKKIRTPDQEWQPIESYITRNSEAAFSHTFCPDCGRKYFGELLGGRNSGPTPQDPSVSSGRQQPGRPDV